MCVSGCNTMTTLRTFLDLEPDNNLSVSASGSHRLTVSAQSQSASRLRARSESRRQERPLTPQSNSTAVTTL